MNKAAKKKAIQAAKQKATTEGIDPDQMKMVQKLEEIFGWSNDSSATAETISKESLYKGMWLQPMSKKNLETIAESFEIKFPKSAKKEALYALLMSDPRVQTPAWYAISSTSSSSNVAPTVHFDASSAGTMAVDGHKEDDFSCSSTSTASVGGGPDVTATFLTERRVPSHASSSGMMSAEVEKDDSSRSTFIAEIGPAAVVTKPVSNKPIRYTGPIPSLSAGDWIRYQFEV